VSAPAGGGWWREPRGRFLVEMPPGWLVAPDGGPDSYLLRSTPPGPGELTLAIVDGGAYDIDARQVIAQGAEDHAGARFGEGLGFTRVAYSTRELVPAGELYVYTWEIGLRNWVSVWSFALPASSYDTDPGRRQMAEVQRIVESMTL
jgi:hypothetical protein